MQLLPREVLTNILNVLPWNEAIRMESLSSQFYDLPYEKPFMSSLIMCGKPHWCFSIFDCKARKFYDFLMMMNDDEASQDVFENYIFKWPRRNMKQALRNYQFWKGVEPRKIVEFAVRIYRKLMRRFKFEIIGFSRLPEEFYRSISPVNPKAFRQNHFRFEPIGTKLNDTEWSFLKNINGINSFNFFGDPEFEGAMNLWSLPCVQTDCLSRSTHLIRDLELRSPDYTRQNVERIATRLGFGQALGLPILWEKNIESRRSNDFNSIRIKVMYGFFIMRLYYSCTDKI